MDFAGHTVLQMQKMVPTVYLPDNLLYNRQCYLVDNIIIECYSLQVDIIFIDRLMNGFVHLGAPEQLTIGKADHFACMI